MNEMEQAVLDMIERRYKKKYIGGIEVKQLVSGGYVLKLDLGNPDVKVIQLSADLDAEDFLKYIEQELISRQLCKVQFFKGIKTYPEDEERGTCCQN